MPILEQIEVISIEELEVSPPKSSINEIKTQVDALSQRVTLIQWIVGINITITLAVGAWTYNLNGVVNKIDGKLDGVILGLNLKKASESNSTEAKVNFSVAENSIREIVSKKLPVPRAELLAVADRGVQLSATNAQWDPDTESKVWRTVSFAITVASQSIAANSLPGGLPDCIEGDGPPGGAGGLFEFQSSNGKKTMTTKAKGELSNCTLVLDKQFPSGLTFAYPKGLNLKNCLIKYSGGKPVITGTLRMTNCLFVFDLQKAPAARQGLEFVQALIDSGLSSSTISADD